jgi:UDP-glucose 4-epimerase
MNMENRHILITGAGGFIGSHLSDRLANNNTLTLVDDFSVGCRENLQHVTALGNVRIVESDVRDTTLMTELARDVDVIFHMAISCLRTSLHDPFLSHHTNAGGTLRRLVYVSSSEVYGTARHTPMNEAHPCHPMTVYGASKLAGELYALAYWRTWGMPVIVVRPFNTYGPREPWFGARAEVIPRFILQLLASRAPVIYGSGQQTRDFTYVADTVSGLVGAAECDALVGEIVNIARGEEASIVEIAQLLCERTGIDISPEFQQSRPGDVDQHFADISLARETFGFAPQVDLITGLAKTIDWFRDQDIESAVRTARPGEPNW